MNDFKLTYLTSFNFSAIFDDCVVRPTVFNSHGWPEEPETSSRLIIFTEDYTRGAFLYNANDVILFSIENFKNVVRSRSEIRIRCKESVSSMCFGRKRGSSFVCKTAKTGGASAREHVLATGHFNGEIRLWDAATSQLLTTLISHDRRVTDLQFRVHVHGFGGGDDGDDDEALFQLISVSEDKTLKVWDFEETGSNMCQTKWHSHPLKCLAWAPGGHLVAAAGTGRQVHVYEMRERVSDVLHVLKGHFSCIVDCKFSPDGALVITASTDTRINIWDTSTGDLRRSLCHTLPVPTLMFGRAQVRSFDIDPNFLTLVSVADDAKLRIWNPHKNNHCIGWTLDEQGGGVLIEPPEVTGNVVVVDGSPDVVVEMKDDDDDRRSCVVVQGGKWVAVTSSESKTVTLYRTNVDVPKLTHLCRMTIRRSIGLNPHALHRFNIPNSIRAFLDYM